VIQLPNGWLPEGIEAGRGNDLFAGSRRHGGIYKVDVSSGQGRILFAGVTGRVATGLAYDARTNLVFASGGPNGDAHVYNGDTGANVASFQLATGQGPTFVNDAIMTPTGVYFTDSMRPVLYRLPLGPGGQISSTTSVQVLSLTGDYRHMPGFNANGIEASASGDALIIVQSNTGFLFRVDPMSGATKQIDIGGHHVMAGDGILLRGSTLYVLRNTAELIARITLSPDFSRGVLAEHIDLSRPPELFETPTTLAGFGDTLYAVNARFTTPPTPETRYTIVRVER
jgi:hypothetical protein